jgi:hypothetical protein
VKDLHEMALKLLKRPSRTLQQLLQITKFCRKAAQIYGTSYLRVFLYSFRLCHQRRFSPDEAFRLGLFNPDLSNDELSKYISRKKLTKIQEAINPISWASLLKDKGIFYRYCMALGVPIPKLYAIFLKKVAGWSCGSPVLTSREDWKKLFDCQLPEAFIVKPAQGAYGEGLNIFSRSNKRFIDASGQAYESVDLYDALLSNPQHESFIIQEQLNNHPELIRLTGIQALQTVRFITIVDKNSRCSILHAHFKPIIGQYFVDTFIDGLTGNVEAAISLNDGFLKPANQIMANGSGPTIIPIHPKTGIPFEGFQLPLWPQTCRLVKETSLKFLPIRTIGWDVAITPDGPLIVEGNIWWDPPNQHRCMDIVLSELS